MRPSEAEFQMIIVLDPNEAEALGYSRTRLEDLNRQLERVAAGRLDRIEVSGDLLRSKIAWKVAYLEQAFRYRLVSLAESTAMQWNARLLVGAIVSARALIETGALIRHVERQISRLVELKDLCAINELAMRQSFASRDAEWISEFPDYAAVNILTVLDRGFPDLPEIRHHYKNLSEYAHPNHTGHRQFFGSLDRQSGTVTFSVDRRHDLGTLLAVIGGYQLVGIAGQSLGRLQDALPRIADAHEAREREGGAAAL